jgi:hypothetical protein
MNDNKILYTLLTLPDFDIVEIVFEVLNVYLA